MTFSVMALIILFNKSASYPRQKNLLLQQKTPLASIYIFYMKLSATLKAGG